MKCFIPAPWQWWLVATTTATASAAPSASAAGAAVEAADVADAVGDSFADAPAIEQRGDHLQNEVQHDPASHTDEKEPPPEGDRVGETEEQGDDGCKQRRNQGVHRVTSCSRDGLKYDTTYGEYCKHIMVMK